MAFANPPKKSPVGLILVAVFLILGLALIFGKIAARNAGPEIVFYSATGEVCNLRVTNTMSHPIYGVQLVKVIQINFTQQNELDPNNPRGEDFKIPIHRVAKIEPGRSESMMLPIPFSLVSDNTAYLEFSDSVGGPQRRVSLGHRSSFD